MNFEECVLECARYPGLIHEVDRLLGTLLGKKRNPIVQMIDKACGYNPDEKDLEMFVSFVYEFIWIPLVIRKQKEAGSGDSVG